MMGLLIQLTKPVLTLVVGAELASDVTRTAQWEPGALITDHPEVIRQTLVDMGVRQPN